MAEDFEDAIGKIIDSAGKAPSVKEAANAVISGIAEQIGVHREDGAALELLADKLGENAGEISDAIASAGS